MSMVSFLTRVLGADRDRTKSRETGREDRRGVASPSMTTLRGTAEEAVPSRFEALWTIDETAKYLMLSKQTLYGWRCRRYGPPSYRLGNQLRYRPSEVQDWVDHQAT